MSRVKQELSTPAKEGGVLGGAGLCSEPHMRELLKLEGGVVLQRPQGSKEDPPSLSGSEAVGDKGEAAAL